MSRQQPALDIPMEVVIEYEMVPREELPQSTTCNPSISNMGESEKETVSTKKDDVLNEKVPPVSHRRDYLVIFYAASAYCMKMLFTGSISPIADVLKEEYDVSLSAVGLLSSSIFLVGLIFSIPSGIILQLVSYQKLLFIAWIGLIVSILLFGFSDSLLFGILSRSMAGVFGACTWLLVLAFAAQYFGNNSVSVISALTICFNRTISFAALTVQAYIYQKYQNWRGMYFVMAIIGAMILIAYSVTMLTSPSPPPSPTADVIANDNGDNKDDDDTQIETTSLIQKQQTEPTTTSAAETKAESQPKEGNAFTNHLNWASCAVGFGICALIDGVFGLWFIPYLMIKFNFDRVTASVAVGIGPWSFGFGALLIGYLAAKYKKRKIFLYFAIVSMSSIFVIIYMKDVPEFIIFVVIIMVGAGGGASCLLFTLTREYNSNHHCADSATGLVTAFCVGSAFVSQNVIGVLLDYHRASIRNDDDLGDYKAEDYQFAFSIVLPTCIIIMMIATFVLKETNGKNL